MPRGGKRTGKPATSYNNRSDLTTQAPSAAPGQTYGAAGAQLASQRQIPLPKQGAAPGAVAPPPAGSTAPAGGGAPLVPPGALGPLSAPTQNPNQPITAGLQGGPGSGPEALAAPDPLVKAAAVLNQLGHNADPQSAALRARVNAMLGNQGAP